MKMLGGVSPSMSNKANMGKESKLVSGPVTCDGKAVDNRDAWFICDRLNQPRLRIIIVLYPNTIPGNHKL